MIDAQNKLSHHVVIGLLSILFVVVLGYSDMGFTRSIAAVSYIILCLVLLIGPAVKIWPSLVNLPPKEFPWGIRGELGVWFAVWAVVHVVEILWDRGFITYISDMSAWAFGAFVAVFMAIILAATSFKGAINFLGAEAWKWLQNYFTYVIFWLSVVHVTYDRALYRPLLRALARDDLPYVDCLHWLYIILAVAVIILQIWAFIKTVREKKPCQS